MSYKLTSLSLVTLPSTLVPTLTSSSSTSQQLIKQDYNNVNDLAIGLTAAVLIVGKYLLSSLHSQQKLLKQTPIPFYEWVYLNKDDPRYLRHKIKLITHGEVKELTGQDELIIEFERVVTKCDGFIAVSDCALDEKFMDAWVKNCDETKLKTGTLQQRLQSTGDWMTNFKLWLQRHKLSGQVKHYIQSVDNPMCYDLLKTLEDLTRYPGAKKLGHSGQRRLLKRIYYDATKQQNAGLGGSEHMAHNDSSNLTILLYNNTVDLKDGGATVFPRAGIKVQPKKGRMCIFFTAPISELKDKAGPLYKDNIIKSALHYGEILKGGIKDVTVIQSAETLD